MDLRSAQKQLKDRYRSAPDSSKITLKATGSETDAPISCSVDIGRAIYAAEAHTGVGGAGTAACSGDLLLGALAACAQITCQMVATAMNVPTSSISATAEGDLDLAGTLGISKEAPVGFTSIRLILDINAPDATADQIDSLREKTEQYCVVMQTLKNPPTVTAKWRQA
ncbi:MAG: OsmC family protein [Rubrobacter sp.]